MSDGLREKLQKRCVAMEAYWRASDAHGVDLTIEQAEELLMMALGVEVEVAIGEDVNAHWDDGFESGIQHAQHELSHGRPVTLPSRESRRLPVDMVLHCPACGLQHIDAPDPSPQFAPSDAVWTNPPHRSHLCAGCGHIWRPADVPTNGVEAVKTKGKSDSPIVSPKVYELAFHGFEHQDDCRVELCFTPSAPRADGTKAMAFYKVKD